MEEGLNTVEHTPAILYTSHVALEVSTNHGGRSFLTEYVDHELNLHGEIEASRAL